MKINRLKISVLALVVFASAGARALPAAESKPAGESKPVITIASAPNLPPGESSIGNIGGKVAGVNPDECKVVVYAYGDVWYVQPWVVEPNTKIKKNGTWQTITHGGYEYAALLVKPAYQPASTTGTLPAVGGDVLAVVKVKASELK